MLWVTGINPKESVFGGAFCGIESRTSFILPISDGAMGFLCHPRQTPLELENDDEVDVRLAVVTLSIVQRLSGFWGEFEKLIEESQ